MKKKITKQKSRDISHAEKPPVIVASSQLQEHCGFPEINTEQFYLFCVFRYRTTWFILRLGTTYDSIITLAGLVLPSFTALSSSFYQSSLHRPIRLAIRPFDGMSSSSVDSLELLDRERIIVSSSLMIVPVRPWSLLPSPSSSSEASAT